MSTITSRLKEYRIKVDLTQEGLADLVGVTRQTINALELGKYEPSLTLAYKLARYFHVHIDDLFVFTP